MSGRDLPPILAGEPHTIAPAPELPQRITGATTTPEYIDAGTPVPNAEDLADLDDLDEPHAACALGTGAEHQRHAFWTADGTKACPGWTEPDLDEPVPYVPTALFSHPAPPISSDGAVTPSSPAPSDDARPPRILGFNVVTIDPEGNPGPARLDGVVSRQRALDELDELAPFMTDGYTSVLVELREVKS